MNKTAFELIDALYERLSQEDELQGESNRIQHQKFLLKQYAGQHGFTNIQHYYDDGYSRAVRNVYRLFLADPDPAKIPILGDLYDELLKQPEPEAARIAAALELYVSGSLNVFNHRTIVELENRLVRFDIKQLGKAEFLHRKGRSKNIGFPLGKPMPLGGW